MKNWHETTRTDWQQMSTQELEQMANSIKGRSALTRTEVSLLLDFCLFLMDGINNHFDTLFRHTYENNHGQVPHQH